MLVAECTSCPPGQQVWQRDQAGRPLLLRPRGWYVSLSHAEALVAAALSRDGPVGVDVERLRPLADRGALARTALCAAERRAVDAMPEASRDAQLLRFWTRKEAVAKALGTGIAIDLRAIVTTVGGTVVSLPEECGDTAAWSVADLPGPDGPDGSVAAVAVRAAGIGVRTRAVPLPACAD
jgi:4'-phosphopantetheinyl transferase